MANAHPQAGPLTGPLAGIRVLDLSAYIAGPYGCTLLADQGAEVLKIEPPDGDNLRSYPSTLQAESRGGHSFTQAVLRSRYLSKACSDLSRPLPDCL